MDTSIITYSKGITVPLTRLCRNNCAYCGFRNNEENLAVPYSTIKSCKAARKANAREVLLMAGERPDGSNAVRAKLDVWGYESYIDYIYSICELIFLEGLLPNLNIGYINEKEVQVIRRIAPVFTVMLESGSEDFLKNGPHREAPYKTLESRLEVIRNAGIGKVPVTTGVIVGLGEPKKSLRDAFELIKDLHKEYGHIQNVLIQNFVPKANSPMAEQPTPTKKEMLEAVVLARKTLPNDIVLSVPLNLNPDIMPFIQAGVRDLGMIDMEYDVLAPDQAWPELSKIERLLKAKGWGLQRRLPIFTKYVRNNWYSRKLSQLLDKYKIMILQSEEKAKEAAVKTATALTKQKAKSKAKPKAKVKKHKK
jgi:FO synthase subunit 1